MPAIRFLPINLSVVINKKFKSLNLRQWIAQKGMTFDYDFNYSIPLFSSPLKKEGRRKENE